MFLKSKSLNKSFLCRNGRNHKGVITSFHRGGGKKNRLIFINRRADLLNDRCFIFSSGQYRQFSAHVSLIGSFAGFISYAFSSRIKEKFIDFSSQKLVTCKDSNFVSNFIKLRDIPLGSFVCNIELRVGLGGKLCRSAGSHARLVAKKIVVDGVDQAGLIIRKRLIFVPLDCRAYYGVLPNQDFVRINCFKAGRSRNRGIRPTVRGVAMNPHDHPHGGGENKSSGGRHNCTPWGKLTKGFKTIRPKRLIKYKLFVSRMNHIVG